MKFKPQLQKLEEKRKTMQKREARRRNKSLKNEKLEMIKKHLESE